ncbi:DUF2568 domain-containing protein [Lysinibacillus sp. 54212]|uniref:DUF2568 domain-containing protein n=1 Tax=Lysinibacillus sp. 54212 TaxID=3119829 RepID=UPI003FA5E26B
MPRLFSKCPLQRVHFIFTRLLFCLIFLIILIIVWGTFGSPNAQFELQGFYRLLLELGILSVAIFLVWNIINPAIIIIFSIVFIFISVFLNFFEGNI